MRIRKRVIVALIALATPIVSVGVWTAMYEARENMRRRAVKENHRQIGIALDNYFERHPSIDAVNPPGNGEDSEANDESGTSQETLATESD